MSLFLSRPCDDWNMRRIIICVLVSSVIGVVVACGDSGDESNFGNGTPEAGPVDPGSSGSFVKPDSGSSDGDLHHEAGPPDCDADPASCLPPGVCGDGKPGLG